MGKYRRFREYKMFGRYYTKFFRMQHQFQSKRSLPPPPVTHEEMKQKYGINIWEPYERFNDEKVRLIKTLQTTDLETFKQNHPALAYKQKIAPPSENFEGYKLFDGSKPMSDGVSQALSLIKGVLRPGLPSSLMNSVDLLEIEDLDETLKRLIMQSQAWDTTFEKLPKRKDKVYWWHNYPRYYGTPQKRKNQILLECLYRYALTFSNQFPELKELRYFKSGTVNALVERNEDLLRFMFEPHMTISATLPSISVEANVERTKEEKVPDVYPILATNDLAQDYLDNVELKTEIKYPLMHSQVLLTPHTFLTEKEENLEYPWTQREMTANAVLNCFGGALAVATQKYGNNFESVFPEPVVTRCVQVSGGVMDFIVVQLNTIDLKNDEGVKNIVYVDGGNHFFTPAPFYENMKGVIDLEPNVFRKFLGLLLNGNMPKK